MANFNLYKNDNENYQKKLGINPYRAIRSEYSIKNKTLRIMLYNKCSFEIPVYDIEGLRGQNPIKLSNMEISPSGEGLYWPDLDVDHHIPSLIQGCFGSRKWMAQELGAKGGKSRSVRKIAASRENGAKGGRPKKELDSRPVGKLKRNMP